LTFCIEVKEKDICACLLAFFFLQLVLFRPIIIILLNGMNDCELCGFCIGLAIGMENLGLGQKVKFIFF
jgi:hypothetical protein